MVKRFEIYLVALNPTKGAEIQKTRPSVIISPNEMNVLKTVIIAPMTSKGFDFIFRPKIDFQGKSGLVLLDQLRAVDKTRLVKKIGETPETTKQEILKYLHEMFR